MRSGGRPAVSRTAALVALGGPPRHVTFVPIDLATHTLDQVMPGSGFRSEVRTFFICEGLTHYLSGPVVDAMCRYVGGRAAGTRVVFTYIHRGMLDGSVMFYLIPLGCGQERLAEFQRAALEAAPR